MFRRLALFQVNVWRRDLDRLKPHLKFGPKDLLVWTSKYEDAVRIVEENRVGCHRVKGGAHAAECVGEGVG